MKKIGMVVALILVLGFVLPAIAGSTTKLLSTNFTLVNMGDAEATGSIEYYSPDGTAWRAAENFTLAANGGQGIYRQYDDAALSDGRGSVVVSADQPLGAVVQILARGQDPTSSGAYSGFDGGDSAFYVPLVMRELVGASGKANSQIIVQNMGAADVVVDVQLNGAAGLGNYTKQDVTIKPGASYLYDLADEDSANVADSWYGSAVVVVDGVGEIGVVSNLFTGDALQTFNAFSSAMPSQKWFVPLFTSRLGNTLSTPLAVQNLSGGDIAANGVTVTCTPDAGLAGATSFTMQNPASFGDGESIFFNPVTDMTIPAAWYGSCVVEASANVVAFVQMRTIATGQAAAYEAIPAGGTDTTAVIPLVAKRLGNGFATAVTIQNLAAVTATVNLTYNPSSTYGGSSTPVTLTGLEIGSNASIIQNHRTGVPELPDGWYGTLVVESNQPVASFVQLTNMKEINPSLPDGDTTMAHNAFTK